MKIDSKDIIKKCSYEGEGCAIAVCFLSLLSEHVKGKSIFDIKSMTKEDVFNLVPSSIKKSRENCATIGFSALQEGVDEYINSKK